MIENKKEKLCGFINKIINGDCLNVLKDIPDNNIDCLVTDPPYGYSFMGKDWDKAIIGVKHWKECLRVLKPGAFAFIMSAPRQDVLSRMIVNLSGAGFEVGFTSIYWTYACLSEDTEVLTENGWKNWKEIKKHLHMSNKLRILIYDEKEKIYKFESPSAWNSYSIQENMFRIKSEETDQLVSRNHRVYTKQGFVFAENLKEQDEMVFLSSLSSNIRDIPIRNKKKAKNSRYVLHNKLSSKGKYMEMYKTQQKVWNWWTNLVRKTEARTKTTNDGRKKSSLERWSYISETKGQLCKLFYKIYKMSKRIYFYGSERWLCYGTSIISIPTNWQDTFKNRDCSSQRPQSRKQFSKQSTTFCQQSTSQTSRSRESYKTTLATIKQEYYEGIIYCPTVSTGCFVARRNGKIFLTGNSGFPKAGNIGKMVDKRLGRERKVINRNPNSRENCDKSNTIYESGTVGKTAYITKGSSELEGSYAGFQPKPAVEVILVVMKPLSEKGYIDQAMKNGKGITWLDDARIPYASKGDKNIAHPGSYNNKISSNIYGGGKGYKLRTNEKEWQNPQGRFPANLICSDDVLNDGKISKSQKGKPRLSSTKNIITKYGGGQHNSEYADSGSFSRYFDIDKWWAERIKNNPCFICGYIEKHGNYIDVDGRTYCDECLISGDYLDIPKLNIKQLPESVQRTFPFLIVPKASKNEKNKGCEGLLQKKDNRLNRHKTGRVWIDRCDGKGKVSVNRRYLPRQNTHPTVKPIKLGCYLTTLGSREGDIVLDPFCGSGSFSISAKILNRRFIGIDNDIESVKIANARIEAYDKKRQEELF